MSERHPDLNPDPDAAAIFEHRLNQRAAVHKAKGDSAKITLGAPGEQPIDGWFSHNVSVRKMPDDEQGILRISIGGGDHLPLAMNYCTFRGERQAVIDLLKQALAALESRRQSP